MADLQVQPKSASQKVIILRAVSMVVGCLGMAFSGSVFVFNVYANALKAMFNMTQSEVELVPSLAYVGATIGFPAGLMLERCGPAWTALLGLMITVASYVVLWSSTTMRPYYHSHTYLLGIIYTVTGFGRIFMYMVSLVTNMQNFSSKHRGMIVGLLDASFSAGPTILALIYGAAFVQGHVHDEENQKVGQFFILLAVANGIVGVLQMVFIRTNPPKNEITPQDCSSSEDDVTTSDTCNLTENTAEVNEVNLWGRDLLTNLNFHLIAWPFIFCTGLQMVVINNLTIYLKSANLAQHSTLLTTLLPLTGMLVKIPIGFASDKFIKKIPRVAFILIANILNMIAMALCIPWSNSLAILIIATVTTGCANGICWILTPTMITDEFGIQHFGWNWGWFTFSSAVFSWILQTIFGVFYQKAIKHPSHTYGANETQCFGPECFKWSFIIATTLNIMSVLLNSIQVKKNLQSATREVTTHDKTYVINH